MAIKPTLSVATPLPSTFPINDQRTPPTLMTAPQPSDERRYSSTDRRQSLSFINWRHLGFRGRRRNHRRQQADTQPFVDHYDNRLLYVVIGIVVLSFTDAFITLKLLSLGAVELNTLMASLIEKDLQSFIGFKIALTSAALVLLVIYNNFRVFGLFKVSQLLWLTLFGYTLLIIYELVLLAYGLNWF